MQPTDIATFYDQVPYPRLAYHYTHPDRMAVIGRLFGMQPKSVAHCRVLELGCAAGANLVPLAYTLPRSEFVGVDLSIRQIAEARAMAAALNLDNVRLEQMDLCELNASYGEFDYVVAHGLYSWVPECVQSQVLDVCASVLAPHGIVYVSYNAFPGCHLRRMLRGMAMYHVRSVEHPREIAPQVRGLIEFLAAMARPADSPYALVLHELKQTVAQMSDSGLIHELLEADNHPVLFHDFIRAAEAAGLQYLTEATFADRADLGVKPDVLGRLREQHGEIGSEQYLDFFNGQSFRRTLLCRCEVTLDRSIRSEQVDDFLVASSAETVLANADLAGDTSVRFVTIHGVATSSHRPIFKIALVLLAAQYPLAIPFPELCQKIGLQLGRTLRDDEIVALRGELLSRFMMEKEVIELRLSQPLFTYQPGPLPLASSVAMYQAAQGWPLVTLTHKMTGIPDSNMTHLLPLLDGEHNWEQLVDCLANANVSEARASTSSSCEPHQEVLRKALAYFARHGLLVQ
ncbi:MAG: class I SAM-dependent methyltransferase [Planctomycetia bacterium]|nr:class I SAM-dependent methyltransferase [Planctomycetia bacterium]